MASVKTLQGPDGKVRGYRIRWRDSAGRSRTATLLGATEREAHAEAARVEADKRSGTELDRRSARLTLGAWAAEWQAVQVHAPGSVARVDAALAPLLALLGPGRPLAGIRPSHIQVWRKARLEAVKSSTVRTEWTWVNGLFEAAVADRLIGFNPCDGIKIKVTDAHRVTVPDTAQIAAIAAGLPAHYRFIGPLGARTGLRPAELLGLHVGQVDFLRLAITVDRQLAGDMVVGRTKSVSSRRVVPVTGETVLLLSAHLAAFPASPAGLVFHRADGRPLVHRTVDGTWARVAAKVGAAGVRLHDMRHYYASVMIRELGGDIVTVSKLLGHSSPAITSSIYAHVLSDWQDRARAALGRAFPDVSPNASLIG